MRPLLVAASALLALWLLPRAQPELSAKQAKPAEEKIDFLLGKAYKLPSEYTNQESTYFSIIGGLNERVYVGTAKYGVNAYLLEFDPKSDKIAMVMDVHKEIGSTARGFAAQSKIHTRCNVGASGKIYVGTKQGYPEKGEKVTDYLGGYVLTYDPKTGKTEHFGVARKHHGIISVTPDESRGIAYVSTCSDSRPIDSTHFMVLDLKTKKYTDLGDMEQAYAFIVLDDKGRAYHPKRGGTIVRYDPETKKSETLKITIDGKPADKPFTGNCILNWDWSSDHKTLWCVEMSTNALYKFDLTAKGDTIPGTTIGTLLPEGKDKPRKSDCRAMCVGPDGRMWAAVTEHGGKVSPLLHLVSYKPGEKACRDHGVVGISNSNFTTFTDDKGKPKPWHHTMPKRGDKGTLSPWQPMGVCAMPDGSVYVLTIAPFTLIKYTKEQVK
jgi:sugar lactone lactonase YvrE